MNITCVQQRNCYTTRQDADLARSTCTEREMRSPIQTYRDKRYKAVVGDRDSTAGIDS